MAGELSMRVLGKPSSATGGSSPACNHTFLDVDNYESCCVQEFEIDNFSLDE
jgi:hypothetical protein